MSWTDDQLARVGDATELELATRRSGGTRRRFTTMWVVRVDDDLYVRSAGGPDRPWYRHALASGGGQIRAGGIDTDAAFIDAAQLRRTTLSMPRTTPSTTALAPDRSAM